MKTMNLKKAASVMVLASVATVMSAQTPEKLFNDELAGKRVTVREVCAKTDLGYVKSVRSEMTYSDKGELQSKDIYRWDESSQSWKLSRSYDYAPEGIRFTNYER